MHALFGQLLVAVGGSVRLLLGLFAGVHGVNSVSGASMALGQNARLLAHSGQALEGLNTSRANRLMQLSQLGLGPAQLNGHSLRLQALTADVLPNNSSTAFRIGGTSAGQQQWSAGDESLHSRLFGAGGSGWKVTGPAAQVRCVQQQQSCVRQTVWLPADEKAGLTRRSVLLLSRLGCLSCVHLGLC